METERFSKAKENFKKALEFNENNEYAKTNLNILRDL